MADIANTDVLLVEDDPDDVVLVREALAETLARDRVTPRINLHHVASLQAAMTELSERHFDAILLDLHLPDGAGMDLVRHIIEQETGAAIIVLTGLGDADLGTAAVQLGAQDFLFKSDCDGSTLRRSIRHSIERQTLLQQFEMQSAQLAASEARLNRVITCSADAILVLDNLGTVLLANPAAAELFDRELESLPGTSLGLPTVGGTTEIEIVRKNGELRIAEVQVVSIEWQWSMAHLATLRDITKHKDTLRQLDETRKKQLKTKDRFLSHVSHELRTPLTVIQQHISLLHDGLVGEIDEEQKHSLGVALRNCRHLEKMIEDLLEATRAEAGNLVIQPARTDVAEAAQDAVASVSSYQKSDHLAIAVEIPDDLPPVLADPDRVRQILINLLGNAVKFTPQGGVITVAADLEGGPEAQVRLSVSDTGCGIPAEKCERVFEALFQHDIDPSISRKGLGLGLHICRQLVEEQRGRIWVESEVGQGSTFRFTLPAFTCQQMLACVPERALERGSFCLLAVIARVRSDAPLQGFDARYLDYARHLISHSVLPTSDLLLPRLASGRNGEIVFVVAGADEGGAAVLLERFLEVLAADKRLVQSRLEFTSRLIPLDVSRVAAEDMADLQQKLAEEVLAGIAEIVAEADIDYDASEMLKELGG